MSWPLASFSLVAAVLLLGWLAYERSRPSARTVALIATLSALAALGRDAFAALDEVKPITAMTFVVGYCLGPLPGFVVGAIGMLASNVLLGQGPYTPWQMAAWGIVGLLGAIAGRASRRRLRRLPLALCCALAALVAKEIMNLYEWTIGAVHTPAALLAATAQGLPFDVVDVVSTLLFGLAFGPELARLLGRMRARTSVEWQPTGALAPVMLALLAGVALTGASPARGASPGALRRNAAPPGASWRHVAPARATALGALRLDAAPGAAPPGALRLDAAPGAAPPGALRLGAAPGAAPPGALGRDLAPARAASSTATALSRAVAYLRTAQKADGGFGAARGSPSTEMYSAWAAIGLAAAGSPPLGVSSHGHSVLDALRAGASTLSGAGDIERTILALHACGVPAGTLAGRDLSAQLAGFREADGSFSGQVNLTAFAIFALRALGRGVGDPAIGAAGRWLAAQQNGDGGFSFGTRGDPSDVDDTAAAMEGIVAAGTVNGRVLSRAGAFLRHAENRDGGFPQQPGGESNAQSTAWAVQGLLAARQPLSDRGRSPISYLTGLLAPDGSIRYARGVAQTPVWVTAEAIAALALRPLPIAAPSAQGSAQTEAPPAPGVHGQAGAGASPPRSSTGGGSAGSASASHNRSTRRRRRGRRGPARSYPIEAIAGLPGPNGAAVAHAAIAADLIVTRCLQALAGLLGG